MKQQLINAVIRNKDKLAYVNLDEYNKYKGWTDDFNLKLPDGKNMSLNLYNEEDLFLLFVLASSWSKTGAWENAAYFTTYLKVAEKNNINLWLQKEFIENEIKMREFNASKIVSVTSGIEPRKKVSFRKDYYSSVEIIAKNWLDIKMSLEKSEEKNDYTIFIDYISNLEGLGSGKNKMRIKILLILRELRCQKSYENIPGEFCCIPDNRVKDALKMLSIKIPTINSMDSILKASKIIYDNFGDLYDIPLFAYKDIEEFIILD